MEKEGQSGEIAEIFLTNESYTKHQFPGQNKQQLDILDKVKKN